MRNEVAASGRCNADRRHKPSWSHRLLASDVVEVLLQGEAMDATKHGPEPLCLSDRSR